MTDLKSTLLAALRRQTPGFGLPAGAGRADLSAWAVLAFTAAGVEAEALKPARSRLAALQLPDGSVCVYRDAPESSWPTSLAVLAWQQAPEFDAARLQAVQFLIKTSGEHSPRPPGAAYAHDSALRGWPWSNGSHSWVIPSALAMLALKAAGYAGHERVHEAQRLLLDRQLPGGGWNYGNTVVFGQELPPMVATTGVALSALADSADRQAVAPSLIYLKKMAANTATPQSLSWALLGLAAWGESPGTSETLLESCWRRQERYGGYDATALALLILALTLPRGIASLFG